jgi:hypothetical protein
MSLARVAWVTGLMSLALVLTVVMPPLQAWVLRLMSLARVAWVTRLMSLALVLTVVMPPLQEWVLRLMSLGRVVRVCPEQPVCFFV